MAGKTLELLKLVAAGGSSLSYEDYPDDPAMQFVDDGEPDTLNATIDAGLLLWSHDSSSDTSFLRLSSAGRQALTQEQS